MPYRSEVQRRKFHAMLSRGEIASSVVEEYDRASEGRRLPERIRKRVGKSRGRLAVRKKSESGY